MAVGDILGLPPGLLALITVLQKVEKLSDRAAADRANYGMDWKYALSTELDDPGFDHSEPFSSSGGLGNAVILKDGDGLARAEAFSADGTRTGWTKPGS
ncbi:transposase [Nonomuraea zeae]|uniref:transposase n=1 Tax=Nonomuraea zeae TaxID=1642303 RepID=UPI00197E27F8|nr:transposase [Nonomuraea zeae]